MHRILMRAVCLDYPAESYDAARAFWTTAFGGTSRPAKYYPEYTVLEHPASLTNVYVQQLGDGAPRMHFDIESDDQPAEVARLVAAGAVIVEEHPDPANSVGDWTVLRDPAGVHFCVTKADVDDDFEAKAVTVG
jgi:predicted enzyme related to lactoylglutathione lyase